MSCAFRMGRARERVVAQLLSQPDRLLTAVLFWNLIINLTYFAVSIIVAHQLANSGQNAAAGAFGLVSVFGIILLGEVLPKSFAVVFRRRWAKTISWPLAAAVRSLDPILPKLGQLTRIARRTFWPEIRSEPYLNADDLERAVEASKLSARRGPAGTPASAQHFGSRPRSRWKKSCGREARTSRPSRRCVCPSFTAKSRPGITSAIVRPGVG